MISRALHSAGAGHSEAYASWQPLRPGYLGNWWGNRRIQYSSYPLFWPPLPRQKSPSEGGQVAHKRWELSPWPSDIHIMIALLARPSSLDGKRQLDEVGLSARSMDETARVTWRQDDNITRPQIVATRFRRFEIFALWSVPIRRRRSWLCCV